MSAPAILEAGRQNVIASFNRWCSLNLPGTPFDAQTGKSSDVTDPALDTPITYGLQFDRPVFSARLPDGPVVCISDKGLFGPASFDVNDRVGFANGQEVYGHPQQTYVEVVVWGDTQLRPDEMIRVRRIRDLVLSAFLNAGRRLEDGTYICNPMQILDFSVDLSLPTPTNNFIRRNRESNWLVEGPVDDPERPDWIGWRMLLKFEWTEFFS